MSVEIDERLSELIVYWQTLLSDKYDRTAATVRVGSTLAGLEAARAQAAADDELMDQLEGDVSELAEEVGD
jgi:hypothetical protein